MRALAARIALAAAALAAVAAPARAAEPLSDVNVRNVRLAVDRKGEALVTYTRADGSLRRVLIWGAVDAVAPGAGAQAHFRYDYAGGWRRYHRLYWKRFANACRPYDGPALVYLVAACKAPDGSYWALQSWQRGLPLLGFDPWTAAQSAYELDVSHWTGELPKLEVGVHWTYGFSAVGVFGRLTYQGQAVHGFRSTSEGNPFDRFGRNVYIDTLDSAYGPGWKRESGILVHTPGGTFCHSFVAQKPFPGYPSQQMRPAARGDRYRVTVLGPGVTPVIQWEGPGLPTWTGSQEQQDEQAQATALWKQLMPGDARCARESGD